MASLDDPQTPSVTPEVRVPATATSIEERCFFFELPAEIRDIIHEFAYHIPKPVDTRIVIKHDWDKVQEIRRNFQGDQYIVQPFPDHKVSSFAVNKSFLLGAATAYISAQRWHISTLFPHNRNSCGLLSEFATDVHARPQSSSLNLLRELHHLTSLTINFDDYTFPKLDGDRYAWEDDLDAMDFEELKLTKYLREVRGLKALRFEPGLQSYAREHRQQRIWEKNVQRFEDYLRPFVSRSKKHLSNSEVEADLGVPLYLGSRVRAHSSALRSNPPRMQWRRVQVIEVRDGLTDEDVPDTEQQLLQLVDARGAEFMAWIRAKKELALLVRGESE
ncbi:hypothetical protein LTR56_001112 [Elasticomyces elasticus]|nr:hypothetical protein LTR56_001112 [Elasticomyces elasticus]KAK3663512.1 hypothetical protein LTR22_005684 [Elasticomyces elasticus]KAK4927102.1 hypothetical protein LTR49_006017 [Elasticomyces elasticus]KAK5769033.1 hypothetical protein LTS12_000747 [Elasticomyces elasticus]